MNHLIRFLLITLVVSMGMSIPSIAPVNTLLYANSSYTLSYFAFSNLEASSFFQLDFSQTRIEIPEGNITATAQINDQMVSSSNVTAFCNNKICKISFGAVNKLSSIYLSFGQFVNPKFTSTQSITAFIYFKSNQNQTHSVSIPSTNYQPMPVTANSVTQSDQGVGTQNVTYTLNISFTYIPKNPYINVQIPDQIGYSDIVTQISFYGTVQNILPTFTSNIISLQLVSNQIMSPSGFMLLTLHGFRNPRYIGSSKSFNITMGQRQTSTTNNCITCRVAQLYGNATNLLTISSSIPGDISTSLFSPSNSSIAADNTVTIGVRIVAPIPVGGKFRILLPAAVQPSNPVTCNSILGFSVTSNSYCVYDSNAHAIQTVEFYFPYLEQAADLIFQIGVKNPSDNRRTQFSFQSYDDKNRAIGSSRTPYPFYASPLDLKTTLTKNNTEIESVFSLYGNLTLSRALSFTNDKLIITLPPSTFYNLTTITCISASQTLVCNKTIDSLTGNLLISFAPPCVSCSVNSTISFSIHNLINPSYKSSLVQQITVQTSSQYGLIESSTKSVSLIQKQLIYTQYNWSGGQFVGDEYQLELTFSIPQYIQNVGGYVEFYFGEDITYAVLETNSQTPSQYQYPTSLTIKNQNDVSLVNYLEFYSSNKPYSLKFIKIKICTTDSPCSSTIKIQGLRKPYYKPTTMDQTIQTTTLNGQPISLKKVDCLQYSPKTISSSLALTIANSVVNSKSNYVLNFTMPKLPFQSGQTIALSSQHSFASDARCFVEIVPSNSLTFGIDCDLVDSRTIKLSFTGDVTQMTLTSIKYAVTIIGVMNPYSVKEISYTVSSQFNNQTNAQFSALVGINKPFPLVVSSVNSTNQTIGQQSNLSMTFQNSYYQFDQMKITIPKSQFEHLQSLLQTSYNMNENSTHFILNQIYQINNSRVTLQLTNSFTISSTQTILVQMYVQGYLSSEAIVPLAALEPVFLKATVQSNNRMVGESTTLTVSVERVNSYASEKYLRILFDHDLLFREATAMNSSFATVSASEGTYSYTEQIIGWSNKTLNLSQFFNMKFVPSNTTLASLPNVQIYTLDANYSPVSKRSIPSTGLVPNSFSSASAFNFLRSFTKANQQANLTLSITSKYPSQAAKLQITLPFNQNKLTGTTACFITNTSQPCTVYSQTQTEITIAYTPDKTVILNNVLNLYPSSNKLKATLLTDLLETIEVSEKSITPSIQLDPVQVSLVANSSVVASPVKLDFTIRNVLTDINVGSKLQLIFPENTYTKVLSLNSKDCSYQINSVLYHGCQYSNTQNANQVQWLSTVTLSNLGSQNIVAGSIIKVTLYLTNPWTAYSFSQRSIRATFLNTDSQSISSGLVTLSSVYPSLTAFQTVSLSNYSLTESNITCGKTNTMTLSMTLQQPIFKGTKIFVTIPNPMYNFANLSLPEYDSQDSTNIYLRKQITCNSAFQNSSICLNSGSVIIYSIQVINEQFNRVSTNLLNFQLTNDLMAVTTSNSITISSRTPSALSLLSLERGSSILNQDSFVTLKTTFNKSQLTNKFSFSVKSDQHSVSLLQSLTGVEYITSGNQTISAGNKVSALRQASGEIIITIENAPYNQISLKLIGKNPLLTSLTSQKYMLSVFDDALTEYYKNSQIPVTNELVPYSSGITLHSQNPIVGQQSNYSVAGTLLSNFTGFKIVFNSTKIVPISTNTLSFSEPLGQYTNPVSSNWDIIHKVVISNDTHILYRNDALKITESLQSLSLPQGSIQSINYNPSMRINTQQIISIVFSAQILTQYLIVKTPVFYSGLISCTINESDVLASTNYQITQATSQNGLVQEKHIKLSFSNARSIKNLTLKMTTVSYQTLFDEAVSLLTVQTQFPTKSYTERFLADVYGDDLNASLTFNSAKTNQINTFKLNVTPLSKQGILKIYYPKFIKTQLSQTLSANSNSDQIVFTVNSVAKLLTVQTDANDDSILFTEVAWESNLFGFDIILQLKNFSNPASNEPYTFLIEQMEQLNKSQIYGRKTLQIKMTELEPITLYSAVRNSSKIGQIVTLTLQIQTSTQYDFSSQDCVITFSQSQVELTESNTCKVQLIDGSTATDLSCTIHPSISNSIITSCQQGNRTYLISEGFKNVLYSLYPLDSDKPQIFIGLPYKKAQTTDSTTTHLTPTMTAGNLTLHQIESSSYVRLQSTQLTLNMTLQNVDEVDCINVAFESKNYLIEQGQLKCRINSVMTECWVHLNSIMINSSQINAENIQLSIDGLINYIAQANFTVQTLKYLGYVAAQVTQNHPPSVSASQTVKSAPFSHFAMIDVFYSPLTAFSSAFSSNTYRIRVINTENYVSSKKQQILIIFDDKHSLPSSIQTTSLLFNISTNLANCSKNQIQFAQSIRLQCTFNQPMNLNVDVSLYHESMKNVPLSKTVKTSIIYPTPSDNCQNQNCDLCSQYQGNQHCFDCRQNMYQYQGGCVESCPSNFIEYQASHTCEPCAATCSSCFNILPSNCLKCKDSSKLSQDGACVDQCTAGYAENGYCVGDEKCFEDGCAACSVTGFCYQCLPDYDGEPTCSWVPLLPSTFMIYFLIPFIIFAFVSVAFVTWNSGVSQASNQCLFSFSLLEFMAWVFIIPAFYQKAQTFLMLAILVLRITIGIVVYETHYKKQINSGMSKTSEQESMIKNDEKQSNQVLSKKSKSQQKSQKNSSEENTQINNNWKFKIVTFIAHLIGPDAYGQVKVMYPNARIIDKTAYVIISMLNRLLAAALLGYILSLRRIGDLTLLPIAAMACGGIIALIRLSRVELLQRCLTRIRE